MDYILFRPNRTVYYTILYSIDRGECSQTIQDGSVILIMTMTRVVRKMKRTKAKKRTKW